MENIEKLFKQEVQEKKKVGRGAFARASRKKGLKGSVKFHADYLHGKAKKEYMKASELKLGIITFEEFKKLSNEEKASVLPNLLKQYPRAKLRKMWGTNHAAMSYYCKKFISDNEEEVNVSKQSEEQPRWFGEKQKEESILEDTKFAVILKGKFTGEDLKKRLTALELILNEGVEFNIEIFIKEL